MIEMKINAMHSASVACGCAASFGLFILHTVTMLISILNGNFRLLHLVPLIFGVLMVFLFSYLISRLLLLLLYPVYLRVSKIQSIIMFLLVGALVPIVCILLIGSVYRSAFDIPFSLNLKSVVGHILIGAFGSFCAASAWYSLRNHEPKI
jgi:hypothetical protein